MYKKNYEKAKLNFFTQLSKGMKEEEWLENVQKMREAFQTYLKNADLSSAEKECKSFLVFIKKRLENRDSLATNGMPAIKVTNTDITIDATLTELLIQSGLMLLTTNQSKKDTQVFNAIILTVIAATLHYAEINFQCADLLEQNNELDKGETRCQFAHSMISNCTQNLDQLELSYSLDLSVLDKFWLKILLKMADLADAKKDRKQMLELLDYYDAISQVYVSEGNVQLFQDETIVHYTRLRADLTAAEKRSELRRVQKKIESLKKIEKDIENISALTFDDLTAICKRLDAKKENELQQKILSKINALQARVTEALSAIVVPLEITSEFVQNTLEETFCAETNENESEKQSNVAILEEKSLDVNEIVDLPIVSVNSSNNDESQDENNHLIAAEVPKEDLEDYTSVTYRCHIFRKNDMTKNTVNDVKNAQKNPRYAEKKPTENHQNFKNKKSNFPVNNNVLKSIVDNLLQLNAKEKCADSSLNLLHFPLLPVKMKSSLFIDSHEEKNETPNNTIKTNALLSEQSNVLSEQRSVLPEISDSTKEITIKYATSQSEQPFHDEPEPTKLYEKLEHEFFSGHATENLETWKKLEGVETLFNQMKELKEQPHTEFSSILVKKIAIHKQYIELMEKLLDAEFSSHNSNSMGDGTTDNSQETNDDSFNSTITYDPGIRLNESYGDASYIDGQNNIINYANNNMYPVMMAFDNRTYYPNNTAPQIFSDYFDYYGCPLPCVNNNRSYHSDSFWPNTSDCSADYNYPQPFFINNRNDYPNNVASGYVPVYENNESNVNVSSHPNTSHQVRNRRHANYKNNSSSLLFSSNNPDTSGPSFRRYRGASSVSKDNKISYGLPLNGVP